MNRRYDAVVVGARVAGASTALLLARAGARVAVLDRSARGSDTVSTHGLMRAGVLQLSRWGILPEVVRAGTPAVRRTHFHFAGAPGVQVTIRPTPWVDALYAPRRHLLDRILVDAAVAAGAEVLHGAAVTGLLCEDGRVRGVRATVRGGRERTLEATTVVGADGIRSGVARDAGAYVVHQGRAASAVLYQYVAGLDPVGYEWAYGACAAAGLIPTNDGLTCVFVATTPDRMARLRRDGTAHAFTTLLEAAAPEHRERVEAARPAGRMHGWAGVPGFVRRAGGPGWALVGDAGYFKDPITTHGMTDALRDADLLAGELIAWWSGEVDERTALARYEQQRDALSGRLFATTERVASYDWDLPAVQRLLREVSASMSDEVELLQARPVPGDPRTGAEPVRDGTGRRVGAFPPT